jgi:hypothetical protein
MFVRGGERQSTALTMKLFGSTKVADACPREREVSAMHTVSLPIAKTLRGKTCLAVPRNTELWMQ